jgi:DNA ligase 1
MMLFEKIKPMLLHKSDAVPSDEYIHQLKLDGHRCLLHYRKGEGVRLFTRHQNECTAQYPELQGIQLNADSVILDGEMIVLDEEARPCFEYVMERFQARRSDSIRRLSQSTPASFAAFDVLYLNDRKVTQLPLMDRIALLEKAVIPGDSISLVQSFEDGSALFDATVTMGLEGIVSKRKDSMYRLDTRSYDWLKVKNYQYEVVEIAGIRKGEFAWSLAKDGKYVGTCEFVPPNERKAFYSIAKQIVREEDKNWIHLEPLIKCKVKFQAWTRAGLMRTPSFMQFVLK